MLHVKILVYDYIPQEGLIGMTSTHSRGIQNQIGDTTIPNYILVGLSMYRKMDRVSLANASKQDKKLLQYIFHFPIATM